MTRRHSSRQRRRDSPSTSGDLSAIRVAGKRAERNRDENSDRRCERCDRPAAGSSPESEPACGIRTYAIVRFRTRVEGNWRGNGHRRRTGCRRGEGRRRTDPARRCDQRTDLTAAALHPRRNEGSGGTRSQSPSGRQPSATPGIEFVALRYGFFYGPGTWYTREGDMGDQVRQQKVPIIGEGQGVYSFVHIFDAERATTAALECPPGAYNIVDGNPSPQHVWLTALARAAGAAAPPRVT